MRTLIVAGTVGPDGVVRLTHFGQRVVSGAGPVGGRDVRAGEPPFPRPCADDDELHPAVRAELARLARLAGTREGA